MLKKKIKKIMKETCFNSLAYCCGLSKECQDRDNVLKKIGLSKKQFLELKQKFDEDLLTILKKNKK